MIENGRNGHGRNRHSTISEEKAKSFASALVEAAETGAGPIRDDDGVVRAPWLQRDGDRLYARGEPEGYVDISNGSPRNDHADYAEPKDAGITHLEYPVRRLAGWHSTGDGVVLISTEGAGWRPEAYVPTQE